MTPPAPKAPAQSEAITLLAALQREGRFVDFLKEDLTGYADAQIGAVARDVHRDCGKVIERFFAPAAVTTTPEGERIAVPTGPEAGNYRLTGKVTGEPPYQGVLQHGGWKATIVEVPAWTGSAETAKLIAPAEVEI